MNVVTTSKLIHWHLLFCCKLIGVLFCFPKLKLFVIVILDTQFHCCCSHSQCVRDAFIRLLNYTLLNSLIEVPMMFSLFWHQLCYVASHCRRIPRDCVQYAEQCTAQCAPQHKRFWNWGDFYFRSIESRNGALRNSILEWVGRLIRHQTITHHKFNELISFKPIIHSIASSPRCKRFVAFLFHLVFLIIFSKQQLSNKSVDKLP